MLTEEKIRSIFFKSYDRIRIGSPAMSEKRFIEIVSQLTGSDNYRDESVCIVRKLKAGEVIDLACEYFGIRRERITSGERREDFVRVRHFIMLYLYSNTEMSSGVIGNIIGRRDHSTVLYGIKSIKQRMEIYPDVKEQYERMCLFINDNSNRKLLEETA